MNLEICNIFEVLGVTDRKLSDPNCCKTHTHTQRVKSQHFCRACSSSVSGLEQRLFYLKVECANLFPLN